MHKWKRVIIFVVIIVMIVLTVSSCSPALDTRLTFNEWVCTTVSSGYPDTMRLYPNGVGVADEATCTWKLEGNRLALSSSVYQYYTFSVRFEDDILYLDNHSYVNPKEISR